MRNIKLLGYVKISGIIKAITGLHIGGTADSIDKGGIDNPVIKNPVTNQPYIPGSSLRGRMRSLLEKKTAKFLSPMKNDIWMEMYDDKDKRYANNKEQSTIDAMNSQVCRVFGNSSSYESVPSMLIVRDALYTQKTQKDYMYKGLPIPITEAKMEIAVDRITAHALPRTIERVPAGAEFYFEIIYKVQEITFEKPIDPKKPNEKYQTFIPTGNSIKQDIENILWALEQIQEHDGLGGNTSRGHGQVIFILNDLTGCDFGKITKSSTDKIETSLDCVLKEIKIPLVLKEDKKAA